MLPITTGGPVSSKPKITQNESQTETSSNVVPLRERQTPEQWKWRFQGALATSTYPAHLRADLTAGIEKRAWSRLKDSTGRLFKDFDAFCRAQEPHGLGLEPEAVRDFLKGLVGERRAALITVSASKQGKRSDKHPAPEGEKSTRQDQRIRAIGERAPEVVKELYSEGLLTAKEAEKFGGSNLSAKVQRSIEAFCGEHESLLAKLPELDEQERSEVRATLRKATREVFKVAAEPDVVYSSMVGDSSDLRPSLLRLHLPKGGKIADPTFGRGVFWKHVAQEKYEVVETDIEPDEVDLAKLPYGDASFDGVVLDPPFLSKPEPQTAVGQALEESYGTSNRAAHGYAATIALYCDGAKEAVRVLRAHGVLIVKCQDTVEGGGNKWVHVEIMQRFSDLGLDCVDLFVLTQKGKLPLTSKTKQQRHARKNHSYFLVFKRRKEPRRVARKTSGGVK